MDIAKLKFLVVDDSGMVCEHIEKLLKELGASRVDKAENGRQALTKISNAAADSMPYALITLDWEMPEMSGLDLLKALRSNKALKKLPVLMITSKATPEHLQQLIPLQPNGMVVKPFSDSVLKNKILDLLLAISSPQKCG